MVLTHELPMCEIALLATVLRYLIVVALLPFQVHTFLFASLCMPDYDALETTHTLCCEILI